MITLYKFGPAFGLPDPSPFCMKAELLLKFAGLDYKADHGGFNKAPKGKQPYINDNGTVIADSSFIRVHIEQKYGFDFDAGLDNRAKSIAWSVEKMTEDHLYWIVVHERWANVENFNRGPKMFFDAAPAVIRPVIAKMVRKKVVKGLFAQGISRHNHAEIMQIAERSIGALAGVLGDNDYIAGDTLCGADAMVFAILEAMRCELFDTPLKGMVNAHENLVRYCSAMNARWYGQA